MKKLLWIPLLLLTACRAGTADYSPSDIRLAAGEKLRFNVAQIRVVEAYQPPLRAPHVEHNFPTPPAKAIASWANDRLQASGGNGVLEVTIEQAAVRESVVAKKGGIEGFFTAEPDRRFDATIHVTMKLYADGSGLSNASAEVNVTRSQELNENASLADRERLFDQLTREIMTQFDAQANAQFRQYFSGYMR